MSEIMKSSLLPKKYDVGFQLQLCPSVFQTDVVRFTVRTVPAGKVLLEYLALFRF